MKKLLKKTLSILPLFALAIVGVSAILLTGCGRKKTENKDQLSPEDVESAQLFGLRQASVDGIDGYAIFAYKSSNPVVTIPETYRGKPILMLSEKAFYKRPIITVNLPATLRKISAEAFSESAVVSVNIASNSQLTTIESKAFSDCILFTSITIPASVTTIGVSAFEGCVSLQTVTFAPGSRLETIGDSAFISTFFTSITIPASVKTIGASVFSNRYSLQTVEFEEGSSLETIGEKAFYYCNSIKTITIPASATEIGNMAFWYCTSLEEITIPASVRTIGWKMFCNCTSLEKVEFGDGSQLETIGDQAFYDCEALTSITIPASVTTIGQQAFYFCTALEEVIFEENSQLEAIGSSVFYPMFFTILIYGDEPTKIRNICIIIANAIDYSSREKVTLKVDAAVINNIPQWNFKSIEPIE